MKRYKGLLIAVTLFVFSMIVSQTDMVVQAAPMLQTTFSVQGAVRDEGWVGISGVKVDLLTEASQPTSIPSKLTDSAGVYKFTNIKPGTYRLAFSKAGYHSHNTRLVTVNGNIVLGDGKADWVITPLLDSYKYKYIGQTPSANI